MKQGVKVLTDPESVVRIWSEAPSRSRLDRQPVKSEVFKGSRNVNCRFRGNANDFVGLVSDHGPFAVGDC